MRCFSTVCFTHHRVISYWVRMELVQAGGDCLKALFRRSLEEAAKTQTLIIIFWYKRGSFYESNVSTRGIQREHAQNSNLSKAGTVRVSEGNGFTRGATISLYLRLGLQNGQFRLLLLHMRAWNTNETSDPTLFSTGSCNEEIFKS
jgi:hypothetical protein